MRKLDGGWNDRSLFLIGIGWIAGDGSAIAALTHLVSILVGFAGKRNIQVKKLVDCTIIFSRIYKQRQKDDCNGRYIVL
jgi:hypothetical protein